MVDKLNEKNIIVKIKFGSHLYGTDNEKSDLDYKGIFLPSIALVSKVGIRLGTDASNYNYWDYDRDKIYKKYCGSE